MSDEPLFTLYCPRWTRPLNSVHDWITEKAWSDEAWRTMVYRVLFHRHAAIFYERPETA